MGNVRGDTVKDTEIGQLPVEWDVCPLGELAEKPQYGFTASAADTQIGPQFLRITDIQDGGVNWATVPYCDRLDSDLEKCRLRDGDLVVARIGATTGKSYLITAPPNAVFASYLIRIRTKGGLLPEFLHQFTNSAGYWRQINEAKGGRLKQGVNIPNLQNLKVPVPPLPEQRAIAQVLRTVQRAKEATEKVLAATKQLKQSLLRHLFTYGPVPFDQADQVELKETEIGPMPGHWEVGPLKSISRLASGGTPSKQRPDFWRGSIAWVSPKDMKSPRLWDAEDHISQQVVPPP